MKGLSSRWFVPNLTSSGVFRDVYSVMNVWGANHDTISYDGKVLCLKEYCPEDGRAICFGYPAFVISII